jgi:hypothetical protein
MSLQDEPEIPDAPPDEGGEEPEVRDQPLGVPDDMDPEDAPLPGLPEAEPPAAS